MSHCLMSYNYDPQLPSPAAMIVTLVMSIVNPNFTPTWHLTPKCTLSPRVSFAPEFKLYIDSKCYSHMLIINVITYPYWYIITEIWPESSIQPWVNKNHRPVPLVLNRYSLNRYSLSRFIQSAISAE